MSDDLSRWNWDGLEHFDYIDGNASTYLETLREDLAARFPQWQAIQWEDDQETDNTERLLAQYNDARRDWAWEICRSFARACHVLTEHIDTYANESYVRTATQWDSLRKIAALVDAYPTPPASASTRLVIDALEEGSLSKGFQVGIVPEAGENTVIFETLVDIDLDPDLNQLYPQDYLHNTALLSGDTVELEGEISNLQLGQPLVFEDETATYPPEAYLIENIKLLDSGNTQVQLHKSLSEDMQNVQKGSLLIHGEPAESILLTPFSTQAVTLPMVSQTTLFLLDAEGLEVGDKIYISDGSTQFYDEITAVNTYSINLSAGLSSETGTGSFDFAGGKIVPAIHLNELGEYSSTAGLGIIGDWRYLENETVQLTIDGNTDDYSVESAHYQSEETAAGSGIYIYKTYLQFSASAPEDLDVVSQLTMPAETSQTWYTDTYIDFATAISTVTSQAPGQITQNDFAVLVNGAKVLWAKLSALAIDLDQETADLTADSNQWQGDTAQYYTASSQLQGHFQQQLRLVDWQKNSAALNDAVAGSDYPLSLADAVPGAILPGHRIFVEHLDDEELSLMTEVSLVDDNQLSLAEPLPAGSTASNIILHANVVLVGHGEQKAQAPLGSGSGVASHQSFIFPVAGLSFIADSAFSKGVRADIVVKVDDIIWQEVESLVSSEPTDRHYTVHLTEAGTLKLTFGDGRHGQRLPTGRDNVSIRYRQGSGTAGNLAANRLTTIVNSNPLVEQVRQPIATSGGSELQGFAGIRQSVVTRFSTLGRAISVADFENLIIDLASVSQAKASLSASQGVKLVVLPSDASSLSATLESTLLSFLQARSTPGVDIVLESYVPLYINLDITVFVIDKTDTLEATLEQALSEALLSTFSAEQRLLGQTLYRGEIYSVVEVLDNVKTSVCKISSVTGSELPLEVKQDEFATILQIRAHDNQLVFFDTENSSITIQVEEFEG
ncbi:MAG: hypothetical protein V3T17_12870 [Pseudomonadales bacterium]